MLCMVPPIQFAIMVSYIQPAAVSGPIYFKEKLKPSTSALWPDKPQSSPYNTAVFILINGAYHIKPACKPWAGTTDTGCVSTKSRLVLRVYCCGYGYM